NTAHFFLRQTNAKGSKAAGPGNQSACERLPDAVGEQSVSLHRVIIASTPAEFFHELPPLLTSSLSSRERFWPRLGRPRMAFEKRRGARCADKTARRAAAL